jgi:hypothetical protein
MRNRAYLLVALFLAVAPAAAEEVVVFKSGSALPIVSHKIDGNMIHVDLGNNGFMAFPMSVVERVDKAGKNVMIGASTVGGTNVMAARPDPTGSFPVHGMAPSERAENNRYGEDDDREYDPAIDVVNGVAVYRPVAGSGNPSKADTAVTGHARVRENTGTPGALKGARQVGTKQVIGAPRSRRAGGTTPAPVITGIEPRINPSRPTTDATQQGGGAGESKPD